MKTPVCADNACLVGCDPFIQTKNLSVRYGDRPSLHDVSLDVPACTVTALIGPSGSGKTSFLSCINRLTDLIPGCDVTGSLRVGEIDVLREDTDVLSLRRRVGMVFQKPNPFPLSIWKNLSLPLKQHGVTNKLVVNERITTALQDAGLWDEVKDRLHHPAQSLSGGQQQRLCIARCIALQPDAVLLDEPCSSLDPMATELIETMIFGLRKRYTVVVVTHNLAQARRIADHVGVFWLVEGAGRLIEHGDAMRVFERPTQPETVAYLTGRVG